MLERQIVILANQIEDTKLLLKEGLSLVFNLHDYK